MGPLGPERHPAAPRSASWRPRRFRPPRTTLPRPHQLHSGGHGDTVSRETPAAQGERRLVSGVRDDATYTSRAHPSNDRVSPARVASATPDRPGPFRSNETASCRASPAGSPTAGQSARLRFDPCGLRMPGGDPDGRAPRTDQAAGPNRHRSSRLNLAGGRGTVRNGWGLTWTKPSRFPQPCLRAPLPRLHRLGRPPGGDERRLGLGPVSPARRGVIVIPWFHPAPTRRRAAAWGALAGDRVRVRRVLSPRAASRRAPATASRAFPNDPAETPDRRHTGTHAVWSQSQSAPTRPRLPPFACCGPHLGAR